MCNALSVSLFFEPMLLASTARVDRKCDDLDELFFSFLSLFWLLVSSFSLIFPFYLFFRSSLCSFVSFFLRLGHSSAQLCCLFLYFSFFVWGIHRHKFCLF